MHYTKQPTPLSTFYNCYNRPNYSCSFLSQCFVRQQHLWKICPLYTCLKLLLSTLRWPNTVFAHASFADEIQHVHKDFNTQTCRQKSDHFSYSTPALAVLFFSLTKHTVLKALVFYYKDTSEKVTMQRTRQFSAFVCYRKNSCSACAVAWKIETHCFCRTCWFLTIQLLEFQEIWEKIVQKPCEWSIMKNLNFDIGNF